MFNFIKEKLFSQQKNDDDLKELIKSIQAKKNYIYSAQDLSGVEEYEELKKLDKDEKKKLILKFINHIRDVVIENAKSKSNRYYNKEVYNLYAQHVSLAVISGLMRSNLHYNEQQWIELFSNYKQVTNELKKTKNTYFYFNKFPVNSSIKQIEYYLKKNRLSTSLTDFIRQTLQWDEFQNVSNSNYYYGSNLAKSVVKLKTIINESDELVPFTLNTEDIGSQVNDIVSQLQHKKEQYYKLFVLALGVSGSKPTQKLLKEINNLIDEIGLDNYKKTAHQLISIVLAYKPITETTKYNYSGRGYEYTHTYFLADQSQNFVKGIVWTCSRFSDKETINLLAKLCEKSFIKIPGKGPAAVSLGNASIYVLGNMRGKDGLGTLSRLKLKIRQNNAKKLIDKYLGEGAKKYNVSVEELKEMAVPDYGLQNGIKLEDFENYKLKVFIDGSKISNHWLKPDGASIKSVPTAVKNSTTLSNKLKEVRKEFKEIQKVYSAQKQRIDNQLLLDRTWDLTSFEKYYLNHGLVQPIAEKLIWSFQNKDKHANALLIDGKWITVNNNVIDWIDNDTHVKLWHPINSSENEIVWWRDKVMDLEWKQPIKQAFRELYILTAAEINTKTYSNRMAAHILKQHQFSSLASLRNWKYSLMGAYDDGIYNRVCSKVIPEHNLKAEFWIDELNQDDAFNDAGIWDYVATDQVRFKNLSDETIDLEKIPKVVLTEILRDVDLFVGVSSVGNDPEWMDNNGERQANRDYWTSYSFGDLNEIAKTRKEVLTRLLPRLKKIRDKAIIDGKFLVVTGNLRTYKIHIGSGNILMEPNDQYLCIVPSRSVSKGNTNKLFIPFEGDRGLSIVLSKAFLLAEDEKIKDTTITSQINRVFS